MDVLAKYGHYSHGGVVVQLKTPEHIAAETERKMSDKPEKYKIKSVREWLENYWYYHKWPTIIGLVLAVMGAFMIYYTMTAPKYDIYCTVVLGRTITESTKTEIQDVVSAAAGDINKDGKALASCNFIILTDKSGGEFSPYSYQTLETSLINQRYVLFIVDDLVTGDKSMGDYFTDYANSKAAGKTEKYLSLSGSPLLAGMDADMRAKLYVTARVLPTNNNIDKSVYYAQAIKAVRGFIKDGAKSK